MGWGGGLGPGSCIDPTDRSVRARGALGPIVIRQIKMQIGERTPWILLTVKIYLLSIKGVSNVGKVYQSSILAHIKCN